ncbi:nicotinamidase [Corallococcus sp. H22C18031201]|uniref:nicotinamidase n=1 Tax=Citreicoccus inhibens TaxID=2849499 RepID=UPI000E75E0E2|nr:nicotinamidase [Citreicoccus inhibens]MBU8896706.1 nicotinamidase [Citreicoccus inhibens]RJS21990.1 nicotinamidase [Corallococcus sp. H22C18031201]
MKKTLKELPLPTFYRAANAAEYGYGASAGKLQTEAAAWRASHGLSPSATDTFNLHLLLIDVQKDFCFPEGSLYVAGRSGRGAIDDSRRISEFLYRNLGAVTNVTATLDTHFAYQIFFPSFWVDQDDQPLTPYREVTREQIERGHARPNPAMARWLCGGNYPWLLKQVKFYCDELERAGKYTLYLWPPHCLLGADGHALAGVVQEARMFHSYARGMQSWVEVKGGNPLTENYSVMRPEVLSRHDGQPLAQRNTQFLKTLLTADAVVIAGQAASHCVKSSIDDLLGEIVAQDAALARKVYLLTDCMSAVTVPDGKGGFAADFTPQADAALKRFADAGMHLVKSTDPLASWPDLHIA